MINTKKDRTGLYFRLDRMNLINKFSSLLETSFHLRLEDGKFVPNQPTLTSSDWVFVKSSSARCDIYTTVFFNILGMIPSYCRECYKVVVSPRSLVELFDLYELMRESGFYCKVGIETRHTNTKLYGGYFYCRGLEEGKQRYNEVRALVDEKLSPETDVILKRYCTNFELNSYPSNELPELTKEELEFEEFVLDHFPPLNIGLKQSDHMIANTMVNWIHYAYMHGDPTYAEFTGGNPLFRPIVMYHKGE